MPKKPRKQRFCKICDKPICWGENGFNEHTQTKRHISLLPFFITVQVPCNQGQVKKVHKHFKKYGAVLRHEERFEDSSAFIDYYYEDPNIYSKVVNIDHWLFGAKLKISWVKPESPYSGFTKESLVSILNSLKEVKTFSQQVEILQTSLQGASGAEIEEILNIIRADLTESLASMFPFLQVHFIGASITTLDFKYSGLDMCISNLKKNKQNKTRHELELPILEAISMLVVKYKKFCSLISVEKPQVPSIKCFHTSTGISCNLTLFKPSVPSSNLIKYYLTLDEKIKPLMVIIKFWVKCQYLKQAFLFSGYALCLLVIFFLQQEPYNLSSVYELQKDCPPDIQKGWNCAFATPENEFSTLRAESLLNLVAAFFRFYSNFDYASNVICPYLGMAIKKTAFIKPFDLPEPYQRYVSQNSVIRLKAGICIQDPFVHAKNVTSVPYNDGGKFVFLCKMTEQYASKIETALLHEMFTNLEGFLISETCFTIEKSEDGKNEQEWFSSLKMFTIKVLKDIIYCRVNESVSSEFTQVIDCMCMHNVWKDRIVAMKRIQIQSAPGTNDFDLELAIASYIFKNFKKQHCKFPLFTVILTMKENPCRVEFVMKLQNNSLIYYHVAHYLRLNFPYWLKVAGNGRNPQPDQIREDEVKEESSTNTILKEGTDNSETIKAKDKLNNEINSLQEQVAIPLRSQPHESQAISDFNDLNSNKVLIVEEEIELEEEEDEIVVEDSDEDDVPSDFFDDFSKEDFLDGFDMAGAWDKESGMLLEDHNSKELGLKKKSLEKCAQSRSPVKRRKSSSSYGRLRSRSRSDEEGSSVESTDSERETRTPSKRKRSRSRSRSRDSSLGRTSDRPKRKSFLEEITEKLNEIPPSVQYNNSNLMIPYPPPLHLLPPPTQLFPTQTQNNPIVGVAFLTSLNQNHTSPDVVSLPQVPVNPAARPLMSIVHQKAVCNETSSKKGEPNEKQTTDSIDKFYGGKKISLHDFLSISTKQRAQSLAPEDPQKNFIVISRCEDVIRAMSEGHKFTVKPSLQVAKKPEVKYQSPLRKEPIVHLHYTSPATILEVDSFGAALDQILLRIGVGTEIVDLDDVLEILMKDPTNTSFVDKATIALTLQESLLKSRTTYVRSCEGCKERKRKVFLEVGINASPWIGLLKDSRPHQTPDRILGKEDQKEAKSEKIEASFASPIVKAALKSTSQPKMEKPKGTTRRGGKGSCKIAQKSPNSSSFSNTKVLESTSQPKMEKPKSTGKEGNVPVQLFKKNIPNSSRHFNTFEMYLKTVKNCSQPSTNG